MNCFKNFFIIVFLSILFPSLSNPFEIQPIEKEIDRHSLSGDLEQMKTLETNLKNWVTKEPSNYMGNFLLGKLYFLMAESYEVKSEKEKGKNWDISEDYIDKSLIALNNSIKSSETSF